MTGFAGLFRFAEETAENTPVSITTAYTDMKVPGIAIVLTVLSLILMVGIAIAGYMMFRERVENWGTAHFIGLGVCLIVIYAISGMVSVAENYIEPLRDFLLANRNIYLLITLLLGLILDCVAVWLTVWFIKNFKGSAQTPFNLGTVLIAVFTFYATGIVASQKITYYFQYATMALTLNSMGFDPFVSAWVESGITEEEAVDVGLQIASLNGWEMLLDSLSAALKTVVQMCQAVIVYGILTEKLDRRWWAFFFGAIALWYVPEAFAAFAEVPFYVHFAADVVIAAAAVYAAVYAVRTYMPEEVHALNYSRKNHRYIDGQQAMPKINMPK